MRWPPCRGPGICPLPGEGPSKWKWTPHIDRPKSQYELLDRVRPLFHAKGQQLSYFSRPNEFINAVEVDVHPSVLRPVNQPVTGSLSWHPVRRPLILQLPLGSRRLSRRPRVGYGYRTASFKIYLFFKQEGRGWLIWIECSDRLLGILGYRPIGIFIDSIELLKLNYSWMVRFSCSTNWRETWFSRSWKEVATETLSSKKERSFQSRISLQTN